MVRIIGRNRRDLKSPENTAMAVIWATLKEHMVMAEYARCKFVEHPSISAVIVWHLADHHTRQDSTVTQVFSSGTVGDCLSRPWDTAFSLFPSSYALFVSLSRVVCDWAVRTVHSNI